MKHHHITIEFSSVEYSEEGEYSVVAHPGAETGDIVWVKDWQNWGILMSPQIRERSVWVVRSLNEKELAEELRERLLRPDPDGPRYFTPLLEAKPVHNNEVPV